MNSIELQQTLPAVFAGRDFIVSDVWHQSLQLKRGEAYLIEAASGTGKSSLCSYIYGYRNDYQGIVSFDGKNIRNFSVTDWVEIRKHSISMLFQELYNALLFCKRRKWYHSFTSIVCTKSRHFYAAAVFCTACSFTGACV